MRYRTSRGAWHLVIRRLVEQAVSELEVMSFGIPLTCDVIGSSVLLARTQLATVLWHARGPWRGGDDGRGPGGDSHLENITPAKRRRDAQTLLALMRRVTGREPTLHGSIVGFGT